MAPFNIPASDESIHCSAREKHENGIAIHVAATKATRGHSRLGMFFRVAGITTRAAAPNAIREVVTTAGEKWSRPIAISRNEQPQTIGGTANIAHSAGPNS